MHKKSGLGHLDLLDSLWIPHQPWINSLQNWFNVVNAEVLNILWTFLSLFKFNSVFITIPAVFLQIRARTACRQSHRYHYVAYVSAYRGSNKLSRYANLKRICEQCVIAVTTLTGLFIVAGIDEVSVQLQEPESASFISPGGDVTLRCHTDASGDVHYEWFR